MFMRSDGNRERVYFGQTVAPWTDYQWQVATDTLTQARELSRGGGAEFIVLYIPRKYRIYRDQIEVEAGARIASWGIAPLPEALSSWCAANDIPFIDTTPLLTKAVMQGIHPYFVDDVHWNGTGHNIAADAVTAFLVKHEMFPFRSGVETSKP